MSDKPDFDALRKDFNFKKKDEINNSDSSKRSNESAVSDNKINDAFEIEEKPQRTENERNEIILPELDSLKQEFDELKKFVNDNVIQSIKPGKIKNDPNECRKSISDDTEQDQIAILSRKLIEKLVWETTPLDVVSKIREIFTTTGKKENFLRNTFELIMEREPVYRICFVNLLKTLLDDEVINSDNILNVFFAIVIIPKRYNENPKIWKNSVEIFYPLVKLGYVKLNNIIRKAEHEINRDYFEENFIKKIQEKDEEQSCRGPKIRDEKISSDEKRSGGPSGSGKQLFTLKELCECLLTDLSIDNEVTNSSSLEIKNILNRKPIWIIVNKILSVIFHGETHQRTGGVILIKYLISDQKIMSEKCFFECLIKFFHKFDLLDDDRFKKEIKNFYTEFINPLLTELKLSCQYFKNAAKLHLASDENFELLCQILELDPNTKNVKSVKKCEKNSEVIKNVTSNKKSKLDVSKNVKAPETKAETQKGPPEPETMPYSSLIETIQMIVENLIRTDDVKQLAEQIARTFNKIQLDSIIRVILTYCQNKPKIYRLKSSYMVAELSSIYGDVHVHNRIVNSISLALGEIENNPQFWQKIAQFIAPLMFKKKLTFADWLFFPRYILKNKEYCQQLLFAVLHTIKMETNMANINELWCGDVRIDKFIPPKEVYKFLNDNNLDFCISNEELLYYKQKCYE